MLRHVGSRCCRSCLLQSKQRNRGRSTNVVDSSFRGMCVPRIQVPDFAADSTVQIRTAHNALCLIQVLVDMGRSVDMVRIAVSTKRLGAEEVTSNPSSNYFKPLIRREDEHQTRLLTNRRHRANPSTSFSFCKRAIRLPCRNLPRPSLHVEILYQSSATQLRLGLSPLT